MENTQLQWAPGSIFAELIGVSVTISSSDHWSGAQWTGTLEAYEYPWIRLMGRDGRRIIIPAAVVKEIRENRKTDKQ